MKKKLYIVIFILALLAAVTFGFFTALSAKVALLDVFVTLTPSAPLMPKTNILVLGIDNAFGHRSDTIMVLHNDPDNKQASVISIPRDTLALIPGRGLDKINHAYAYGGIELSRKTVENLFGIEIPYYIVVDLSSIVKIVDDLGGITIDVEKRMYYADYAGDLHIDLQPGVQKLTGVQAMGYLRYRHDGGDLQRIDRQQKFLRALANEMLKRENIIRSPGLFLSLLSCLDTNLSSRQTLGLSLGLRASYELGQFYMSTIPGSDMIVDGIYYLRPDEATLKALVRQLINGEKITS